MLQLLTDQNEKRQAQEKLVSLLQRRDVFPERDTRYVTWRPNADELDIIHDGEIWFATKTFKDEERGERIWNSFGLYHEGLKLFITIEANIQIDSDDWRISGFFAKDTSSGRIYLMHDGGIGGGKKGVGRDAFLLDANLQPVPVDSPRGVRMGVVVDVLVPGEIGPGIKSFVSKAAAFKEKVNNGVAVPNGLSIGPEGQGYSDYFKEYYGVKGGGGVDRYSYKTWHGAVVDALAEVAGQRFKGTVVKNVQIDLGVSQGRDKLVALFEVKSSIDRQSLYTAIGQLTVHAGIHNPQKFLVVPDGELPDDIRQALRHLDITVINYAVEDGEVTLGRF